MFHNINFSFSTFLCQLEPSLSGFWVSPYLKLSSGIVYKGMIQPPKSLFNFSLFNLCYGSRLSFKHSCCSFGKLGPFSPLWILISYLQNLLFSWHEIYGFFFSTMFCADLWITIKICPESHFNLNTQVVKNLSTSTFSLLSKWVGDALKESPKNLLSSDTIYVIIFEH